MPSAHVREHASGAGRPNRRYIVVVGELEMEEKMKDNQKAALPYWPRGLSRTLAASYVGVSPSTFDRMIKDGLMPRPKAVYGRRLWDVRAVDIAFDLLDGGHTTKMGEGEVYEFSA